MKSDILPETILDASSNGRDLKPDGTETVAPGGNEFGILEIFKIRQDGGTQHLPTLDEHLVALYAERMGDGSDFPPVVVWFDGSEYWLSDGFHRLTAASRIGITHFKARIRLGTLTDALWDSYRANAANGRARKSTELLTILRSALDHPKAAAFSNVELARYLNLPESTLRRWRNRLSSSSGEDRGQAVRTATRRGRTYTIDTAKIGLYHHSRVGKSRKELAVQLTQMKESASPPARRVLVVLENWVLGPVNSHDCVVALEQVLRSAPVSM